MDASRGLEQALPIRVLVDQGVISIKEYSTFPKSPGLEPKHKIQFSVITWALGRRES